MTVPLPFQDSPITGAGRIESFIDDHGCDILIRQTGDDELTITFKQRHAERSYQRRLRLAIQADSGWSRATKRRR